MLDKAYIDAEEFAAMIDVSSSKAYELIRKVNKELVDKGYLTIQGKAPRKYLIGRLAIDLECTSLNRRKWNAGTKIKKSLEPLPCALLASIKDSIETVPLSLL